MFAKMGFGSRWLFLFVLTLAGDLAFSLVPNQPPAFTTARSGLTPLLMYSFRQSECNTRSPISEDFLGALPLTMQRNATTCPTRNGTSPNVFHNAVNGVSVNDTAQTDALRTGSFGSSFSSLGTQLGIELWFSFDATQTNNAQARLIEIGTADGSSNTVGTGPDSIQFLLGFTPASSGNDLLSVGLTWNYSTTEQISLQSFPIPLPASFKAMLASFRTSPLQTMLFIALSISEISGQTQVTAHIGRPGQIVQSSTGPGGFPLAAFYIPSTAIMRIGCTRANTLTGLPGAVHFVAFYRNTIDASRAQNMLDSGFPNSIPVVRTADVIVNEDQITSINLNQTNISVFDFNNNPASSFRLRSMPSRGNLSYNGEPFTSSTAFVVRDINLFTYVQLSPNNFSIATGTVCPGGAYDTFTYVASDGLCDFTGADQNGANCSSPVAATARLCVRDTNDLPFGSDVTESGIRGGFQHIFTLVATDFDDFQVGQSDNQSSTFRMRDLNGDLTAGATIRFNQTTGNFGRIQLPLSDGSGCTNTDIIAGANNSWTIVNGTKAFTFCFRASSNSVGNDVFEYRFTDKGGGEPGPSSRVTFTVVNPLDTCTAAGAGIPCESRGSETTSRDVSATLIPVNLTGTDSLGRGLNIQITSLPLYGKLYVNSNSGGSPGKGLPVNIGDTFAISSGPQLVYIGNADYFNFVSYSNPVSGPFYVNKDGLGIDGCVSQGISCRCGNTATGCPDTFKYIVIATTGAPGQSAEGIYKVYVQSKASDFTLTAPSEFPFEANKLFYFAGSYGVSIVDPDDSVYPVSFILNGPSNSILGWSRSDTNLEQINKISFDEPNQNQCIDVGCGGVIRFVATPNATNVLAFPSLFFNRVNTPPNNSFVTISVIKILPDGTTGDNRFGVDSNPSVIKKVANIFIRTSSTSGSNENSIAVAIYAGSGAAGFLILICCISACVWFVRQSRQAARAVRKSMASRKSHMSHRQSNLSHKTGMVDNEEMADDLRSKSTVQPNPFLLLFCWCCLGGGKADEEDREREQLALAQQRQSLASHRSSHHSVRKSQGGPGTMTPYQAAGPSFVAEPPMKGRELVAPSLDGAEMQVADDSVFAWEKHIDRRTGDVYFFNPRTGVSQWDPPTIKVRRTGK